MDGSFSFIEGLGERLSQPKTQTCDICHRTVSDQYVDGRTTFGPWATMCLSCHAKHGVGLGTGKGQRFDIATGKKLEG